ncbi:MAG TPA: hypothetical protein VFB81_00370 [Myxococcales bacterium]|nr:hypothetical protein [Myxococcales bacterium]
MAVNLESHGLPAAAFGAPVTVQDHQSGSHGQQHPAQDAEAGYSSASAFEQPVATNQAAVEDRDGAGRGGSDLLSRLTGFIKAVGDVVVQLGEYIRSAGAALNGDPSQAEAPAPQAPALGAPAGAPVATGPGGQQALAAPGQPATTTQTAMARQAAPAALPDLRGGPALGSRSPEPTQRGVAKASASLSDATAGLSAAMGGLRGGGRASQSNGFPVLNPLPAYLGGDQIAPIFDVGFEPPAQVEQAAAVQGAQEAQGAQGGDGYVNNIIPFPGPAANDGFQGQAGGAANAQAPAAEPSTPRYQAIVFRPAYYTYLRG